MRSQTLDALMQEEEKRLKEGTHKATVFPVLKEVGPSGLTVSQIMDKVMEGGL